MARSELERCMPGPEPTGHTKEDRFWCWLRRRPEFCDTEALAELFIQNRHCFEEQDNEESPRSDRIKVGIAHLYPDPAGFVGIEEDAWRVLKAFQMSGCSKEVKALVLDVAEALELGRAYRTRPWRDESPLDV